MTYTNIFEKILVILDIVSTSWVYIAFSLISILLIILLGFKKISKKTCFLLITIATKLVLGYTVYIYYEPISNIINSLVDNIFMNIYFPSAYAYLFILLTINVVAIASLLKPRVEKVYKTVNGVCFIITNFILALVLEIIAKNKIDIFTKESLFTNTKLITLLEFGVNIFIIWIISLIAIYLINNITERILIAKENKKLKNNPVVTIATELAINEEELEEEYQTTTTEEKPVLENPVRAIITEEQYKFIPNFTVTFNEITAPVIEIEEPIMEVTAPVIEIEEQKNKFIRTVNTVIEENEYFYDENSFDLSAFIPKKQEIKPINTLRETANEQIFNQILNNELPLIKEDVKPVVPSIEETKNTYTLNDYRIFNNMLKDIREHNQSNSVVIDKALEYRLITKYSTKNYDMFKTMLKIYSN